MILSELQNNNNHIYNRYLNFKNHFNNIFKFSKYIEIFIEINFKLIIEN
jgi:hypothetical protein